MEYYLLRHGHVEEAAVVDPYTVSLSPAGKLEAESLAEACRQWNLQFLCVSTAVRCEQTADIINARLPQVLRWDLKELESLSVDDMEGQVVYSSNPKRWTPKQYRYGIERTWVRLSAVLARIEIYANNWNITRVGLVTHADVINLCLYYWFGLDWTYYHSLQFLVDTGKSIKVNHQGGQATLEWLNCIGN